MRFRRAPRPTPFEQTARKRAAFLRKQRRERDSLPLFSSQIAAEQHGVAQEMSRRAQQWTQTEQIWRDQRASRWREARDRLFRLRKPFRDVVRLLWRTCPYPADPASFADFLHQIAVGQIDPHRPPWIYHEQVTARVTPNPTTFDEAFRKIGQRKVNGGPKTTSADEYTFCGNLGAGILFLISRVRLIEPNESFYTCSNHRLRDSHVGRSGHWVEIIVRGDCTDHELALIERLARAADSRPVLVRRAS
jgi:hypothetical protein